MNLALAEAEEAARMGEVPVGAVLVYGGADAGHVEIRTANGFVSDFVSPTPYPRPFLGAYVKPA